MVLFDTNVVLRYLLNDIPEMADEAEQLIKNDTVGVTTEVLAEVVYVLGGVYHLSRTEIADAVKLFLEDVPAVYLSDKKIIIAALDLYAEKSLDFVDCVIWAYHHISGIDVKTFDKKLNRLLSVNS